MPRLYVLVVLLAAFTVAAWGQGGGPALPPPPPAPPAKPPEQAAKPPVALPDMKDPAAVAAAYGLACQNLDGDTALKLIAVTPDKAEMLKGMFAEFAKGPGGMDGKTAVRQFLLVPIFGMGVYTPGKAEVQGNKATVPVTVTATLEQKFVLVKRADGTWGVDLDATSVATTGQPMFFLHEPGMDGGGGPGGPEGATCLSNLRQVGMAALMFAQDHDETLPAADKWTDELVPYLKNQAVFKCPSAKDLDCAYAINAKVAGKSLAQIAEPATTVLFFESTKGKRNSADAMESLVPKGRHNGGNSFTYVDGHAMWVPFGQDPAKAAAAGGPGGPAARADAGQGSVMACTAHLKALDEAVVQYAHDHKDTLPDAGKWADELAGYVKDPAMFRCLDEAGVPGGYALNARVAGKALADIADPETTVLFFETTSGDKNATDPMDSLVPEGRHHGGNFFAYLDGHVKWVKVGQKP